jgi:hypothetical protein
MTIKFLNRRGGGGTRAYDADALAWQAAVQAAGGSVSNARLILIDQLIFALKACGAWALTDDYAVYAAENSTAALVTIKQRITQVAASSPTFVTDRGFLGNLAGVIKTGWNPRSGSPIYQQNAARRGVWVYSAPATTGKWLIGHDNTTFNEDGAAGPVNLPYGVNNNAAFDNYAHGGLANLVGWHCFERTGATAEAAYLDTVQKGTGTTTTALPANWQMFILGTTSDGSGIANPTDAGASAAYWGGPLSAPQKTGEYNAFRTYMTAVGVP